MPEREGGGYLGMAAHIQEDEENGACLLANTFFFFLQGDASVMESCSCGSVTCAFTKTH